ncbi:MAG TPA: hypothetical protein VKD67_11695, partial [Acidimicrobiales bacterium]|nr:hypothetical protein [Acidimicrobiales bacterium]
NAGDGSSDLANDGVEHGVEELADLPGATSGGGPGDEQEGDQGRAEEHQGVLGRGLADIAATDKGSVETNSKCAH